MLQDEYVTVASTTSQPGSLTAKEELKTHRVQLVVHCKELARFLRSVNESTWASWIDARVTEVSLAQPEGVCNLLDGFIGLGNIGDVFLCPEAGHSISPGDEAGINEQFLNLVSTVSSAARKVQTLDQINCQRLP
ncbi:MAG: hypothetical protein AB8G17_05905 [Gammaproteobacteria bacterium]